jgi:hypothetical protein
MPTIIVSEIYKETIMGAILQRIPVGTLLIDTDTLLGPAECKLLASAGVKGVASYLGLVTPAMLAAIWAEGMGFLPISYDDHEQGWIPTAAMGAAEGALARQRARALSLLKGISTVCDLEGMGGTADDTIAYANPWCAAANPDGDLPTAYIGEGVTLTPEQLYDLDFVGYVHSCSEVPNVAVCGYQVIQAYPPDVTVVNGVTLPFTVDIDFVQQDKKGRTPVWQINS